MFSLDLNWGKILNSIPMQIEACKLVIKQWKSIYGIYKITGESSVSGKHTFLKKLPNIIIFTFHIV